LTAHRPGAARMAGPVAGQADATAGVAALLVVLGGVFMSVLDFFIVNVAVPSIQRDLHASAAQVQWTVAGFGLGYGCGLIAGGRLGDLYGRRRMYQAGMLVFALASAACGLAPTAGFLVAARAVQGVSAALMAPQVLAIIRTAFTGAAQARGFTLYGLTMGIAAVFGQLIGGLLIKADVFGSGWRSCFLINLPVAVVVLILLPRLIPESRSPGRPRLDLPGAALVTLALALVVLPLIDGRAQGWPSWTWLSFAAAAVLLAFFWGQERRLAARGSEPLVHPELFRERAFAVGLLAQLVFWMGQASFFLVFALYAQQGRGLSALGAGTVFIAIGGGYLAASLNVQKFARRMGRQVLTAGGVTMAAGLGALAAAVHPVLRITSRSPSGRGRGLRCRVGAVARILTIWSRLPAPPPRHRPGPGGWHPGASYHFHAARERRRRVNVGGERPGGRRVAGSAAGGW
jgi:MFS family permease